LLPTATKLSADFFAALMQHVSTQMRGGILQQATQLVIHEGNRWRIVREDGSVSESELTEVAQEIAIPTSDLAALDFPSVLAKANELAGSFRKEAGDSMIRTLVEELPKSQQTGDPARPFDHEHFFEALEQMHIDFDENDKASSLSFIVHPDLLPRLKALDEEFNASPELQARHDAIMKKKLEEFREREARRRLVG
jgi:hypothetical protein